MASQKGKDVAKGRFWGKINPDVLKYNQITLTATSCRVSRNISREQFVLLLSGGAGVSQVVSPGWLSTLTGYFTFLLPWIPRGWEGRAFEHLLFINAILAPIWDSTVTPGQSFLPSSVYLGLSAPGRYQISGEGILKLHADWRKMPFRLLKILRHCSSSTEIYAGEVFRCGVSQQEALWPIFWMPGLCDRLSKARHRLMEQHQSLSQH